MSSKGINNIIIFLPRETLWWLKNNKNIHIVCQFTLLWPAIINKTIMQQNQIKSLHHDGNLFGQ